MTQRLALYTFYTLIIGLFTFLPAVKAAPGNLDPTFSLDGIASSVFGGNAIDRGYAMALQPDGKILVAGKALYGYQMYFTVTRFNPDGTLDPSFSSDGKAYFTSGQTVYASTCRGLALQPDGKIVAACDLSLFRFNADGSLDTSFNGGGSVTTPLDTLKAVAVQPDGRILAAGAKNSGTDTDFAIAGFNPDGSLDLTFDADGLVTTDFSIGANDAVSAIAIQPDGQIVAAGSTSLPNSAYALARYNRDGSLDNTFDSDGKVTTSISTSDGANSLAIQPDGKIVAGGSSFSGRVLFSVARYNPDGSLDTSFSSDGKAMMSNSGDDYVSVSITLQPDGRIVQAGYNPFDFNSFMWLIRYNSDGTLDSNFGQNGRILTFFNGYDYTGAVAALPDGRIILAGYGRYNLSNSEYNDNTELVRYNPNGSLDTSFDGDGKLSVDLGVWDSAASAVAIQPDGRIVAGSTYRNNDSLYFGVTRFNPNGEADTSFDGDGKVTVPFGGINYARVNALAVQADGKVILAGFARPVVSEFDFALARCNPDGSLDTSFDSDGKVTTPVLNPGINIANAVVIQPDGKIIAAGSSSTASGGQQGALVRYNPAGSLDPTFDGDGKLIFFASLLTSINAVAIQPDGRIVAAGYVSNGGNSDFAIVRLNPNGSPDTSFGGDGIVVTPILNSDDYAYALALQPDGRIVVAGSARDDNLIDRFALARYNLDGSLDASFNGSGMAVTDFGGKANGVAIQADGKILAAGGPAIIRFKPDGSLDPSYGSNGKAVPGGISQLSGIALDSTGRAVVGGQFDGGFLAVARIINSSAPAAAPFDFDGDRKTDISIFRPGAGQWWIRRSSNGLTSALQFGLSSDKIVPADFTGDGKTDIAVWRETTGEWFILRSEDNSYYSTPFGTTGDVPVPADFDGDGKSDLAVYRPSSFTWYIAKSTGGYQITPFGASGDVPVIGDYDGDGKTDLAIYRPAAGEWWIQRSSDSSVYAFQFGSSTDKPIQGDYTGDGKTDSAFWRPSTGEWFILRSENGSFYSVPFGAPGDLPTPGDYDGDGKFDTAVFRPSDSNWYINRSTAGLLITTFGIAGDRPVPNAFVP